LNIFNELHSYQFSELYTRCRSLRRSSHSRHFHITDCRKLKSMKVGWSLEASFLWKVSWKSVHWFRCY